MLVLWLKLRKRPSRKAHDRVSARALTLGIEPSPGVLLSGGLAAMAALERSSFFGQGIRANKEHHRALDRILGHLSRRLLPWEARWTSDTNAHWDPETLDGLAAALWTVCGVTDYESLEAAHRQLDIQAEYELDAPERGVLIPISVECFVLQLELEADLNRSTRQGALSNMEWAPLASTTAFVSRYELSLAQLPKSGSSSSLPNMETVAELRDAIRIGRSALAEVSRAA